MKKLLSDGKNNTKTAKNTKHTYYLSLQPTNLNSLNENLCKFSTKECRNACLQYSGRQSFSNVVKSRERKTEMFVTDRKLFIDSLWKELSEINNKEKAAIRLNLLSDGNWDLEFLKFNYDLSKLNNIQLYDYSKDHFKVITNKLENYHFTLSYSGYNWKHCEEALKNKINVAMVFKNSLPLQYKGFNVINGDQSDERFLDPKGVIVGLKYKVPRGLKYVKNNFVIE